MTARSGESLVEVLAALVIASSAVTAVLSASSALTAQTERIRRADAYRYGTIWWLNRMPGADGSLSSMPDSVPDGDVRFSCAEDRENRSARLTVRVAGHDRSFSRAINF